MNTNTFRIACVGGGPAGLYFAILMKRSFPEVQVDVVREVLANLQARPELMDTVHGFLIESFLLGGSQNPDRCGPDSIERGGLSITDPCLAWGETETLLRDMAARVSKLFVNRRRPTPAR